MAEGLAVALPLAQSPEDGAYGLHKNLEDVAKQNLKMIILTSPGERVMDPQFGVGIRSFLFRQNTPTLTSEVRGRIESQITAYLPYVKILDLNINNDPDNAFMFIKIKYAVPSANIVSDLVLPVTG
jgi:hypothetical protein